MMKIIIGYPQPESELAIIRSYAYGIDLHDLGLMDINPVISRQEIVQFRGDILNVVIKDELMGYIRAIVAETRDPMYVQLGASPRAAVALLKAGRALAAIRGERFPYP